MPGVARTRPHYGDTLRVEIAGDPWDRPNGLARRLVFEGLTEMGADGNLQPGLAVAWTSENADHRWQFRLRPGVHFHDGSPVTSPAIVASLMASCGSDCPWGAVRALGASLVFTSDAPMPQLPALLAGDAFLISKGQAADSDGGSGPFQVSASANGVLTLIANETSWQGRPFVDAIEIRSHRAIGEQWLDLSAGRADVVEVPVEDIRQAQQDHLNLAISDPVEVLALQLGESGVLSNPNLRSAIAFAIDRNAIANVIFQKQARASAALLPQNVSGCAFLFPAERDLNKAHELRGGMTPPLLSLEAGGSGAIQLAAQRIVLNLREAGFNVQLSAPGAKPASMHLRTFRVAGADPASDLAELVRAAGQADLVMGSDPPAVYHAERAFLDRRVLIPVAHLPRAYVTGSRVRDFHLRYDGTPDFERVSLEAGK